jgi:hypothetical protein
VEQFALRANLQPRKKKQLKPEKSDPQGRLAHIQVKRDEGTEQIDSYNRN